MLFKNALLFIPNPEERASNVISIFILFTCTYLDFRVLIQYFLLYRAVQELWHKNRVMVTKFLCLKI